MNSPKPTELHQLEVDAYQRTGQLESFADTTADMYEINQSIPDELRYGRELDMATKAALWEFGGSPIRRVVAIGSIAVGSWPRGFRSTPERAFYFSWPDELVDAARTTDDADLVTTSLVAVGEQFVSSYDYIPSRFVPWAAAISRLADEPQQHSINEVLANVTFSDHHTDSEDMDDPHDVTRLLRDESVPEPVRQRLLELALADARNTTYKPHVWQSQMHVTLQNLASGMDNPLRFTARNELGLPESDSDIQVLINEQEAERVRTQANNNAGREAATAARNALAKATIISLLQA